MSIHLYFSLAGGVATSILLPVLVRSVQAEFRAAVPATRGGSALPRILAAAWPYMRKYLILGVFSLLTGVLLAAAVGDAISTWQAAFVTGYAWDSTIQKITQKP